MGKYWISLSVLALSLIPSAPGRAEESYPSFTEACEKLSSLQARMDADSWRHLRWSRDSLMELAGYPASDAGSSRDYAPEQCRDAIAKLKLEKTLTLSGRDLRIATEFQEAEEIRLDLSFADLAGLARFGKLKRLRLNPSAEGEGNGSSPLDDASLARLPALPALESLEIAISKLTDFSPLTRLPRLKQLELALTGARDLSWLSGLPGLESLAVRSWSRWDAFAEFDLAALQALPNLKSLRFGHLILPGTLSALAPLQALEELEIEQSRLYTLDGLAELKRLRSVRLSEVETPCPLATKPGDDCAYPKLSALAGVQSLESLTLESTAGHGQVLSSELASLRLPGLKSLTTQEVQVSDLFLRELPELESYTQLPSISPGNGAGISSLGAFQLNPKLKALTLHGLKYLDLSALAANPELETLRLPDCSIYRLYGIGALTRLRELNLSGTALRSLRGIEEVRDFLTGLDVSDNYSLYDLSSLGGFKALKRLNVACTGVSDLSAIKPLVDQGLEVIGFRACP